MNLSNIIEEITNIKQQNIIFILIIILIIINKYSVIDGLFKQIIIVTIVLAIFDVFLKKNLLFENSDEYYIFIINNIISMVLINFLIFFINNNLQKDTFITLFYIAFACLFYELIVFKLLNYNNLSNTKLRDMTKIIMRLSTINILYRYLEQKPYNKYWFNKSFSQLCNFLLFSIVFIH